MIIPLPDKIAIGPLTFRVTDDIHEHNQGVVDDALDTYGRINYAKGRIILDPNQTDAHKRLALLHEVLHGCWHVGDRSHKNDEKAIRSLTGPLLTVLRGNPELMAYLLAEEET
jgi:hypothetical protein